MAGDQGQGHWSVKQDASYKEDENGIGYLDDGFGNCWMVCHDERCDLQIVRPGKVQCSDYCEMEAAGA